MPALNSFLQQAAVLNGAELTGAQIRQLAQQAFGAPNRIAATEAAETTLIAKLWEHLITYNIIGGQSGAIAAVMNALQVKGLLKHIDENQETENLSLDNVSVVLPDTIFPLPKPIHEPAGEVYPTPGMTEADIAAVNAATAKIKDLQIAADDLNKVYNIQLEEARVAQHAFQSPDYNEDGTPVFQQPPPAFPFIGLLNAAFRAKLTASTTTYLQQQGYSEAVRVPFVLDQITRQQETQAGIVSQKLVLSQNVVQVGTSLVQLQMQWGGDDVALDPQWENWFDPIPREDHGGSRVDNSCRIKPLGVADYRRIEQTLICYKPGEVAHIENILKGEGKERSTRRLTRTEDTYTTTTERERHDERDTITTDRYQMEKETSKVVNEDMRFDIGVSVQASYGPVSIQATSNFATAKSSTQSNSSAVSYGKDVTTRALQRVIERTSEQQIHKVLNEFEELNKHVIDNVGGAGHIVGLYRWVDKIYEAKVVNYGKRLMFEFMVPESAAYHIYAMAKPGAATGLKLEKPLHPVHDIHDIQKVVSWLGPLSSHSQLHWWNYAIWAGLYGAKMDPPLANKTIGLAKAQSNIPYNTNTGNIPVFSYNDLVVPENYRAKTGTITILRTGSGVPNGGASWNTMVVGTNSFYSPHYGPGTASFPMNGETAIIPVSAIVQFFGLGFNVEVVCEPTDANAEAWRIKSYNAIMDAYHAQLAEYNNAVAEFEATMGIGIKGTNPAYNRKIEQMELEKHCVRLLTSCTFATSTAWQDKYNHSEAPGQPDFECCTAISEGKFVQFVEGCFDWQLMTYSFYPYFYGRRQKWDIVYQFEDTDPIFQQFLQAGYARVVVPVRPGFEEAAMRFAADGSIYNGGPVPGINDPYYLSIVDEMKKPIGEVEGEPWQLRVPTSLTILQNDASGVAGTGLPCDPLGI